MKILKILDDAELILVDLEVNLGKEVRNAPTLCVRYKGKIIPLKAPLADIFFRIKENAGKLSGHINWGKVRETLAKRTGIPTRITD